MDYVSLIFKLKFFGLATVAAFLSWLMLEYISAKYLDSEKKVPVWLNIPRKITQTITALTPVYALFDIFSDIVPLTMLIPALFTIQLILCGPILNPYELFAKKDIDLWLYRSADLMIMVLIGWAITVFNLLSLPYPLGILITTGISIILISPFVLIRAKINKQIPEYLRD